MKKVELSMVDILVIRQALKLYQKASPNIFDKEFCELLRAKLKNQL